MRRAINHSMALMVLWAAAMACSDPSQKFTIKDKDQGADQSGDGGASLYEPFEELTVCEGADCRCVAVRDCEPVAMASVYDTGSQLIHVCGRDGDRCIFRYEDEDDGAVSRYLCDVPKGRTMCSFDVELECSLVDVCIKGNCPTVDICALYEEGAD